MIALSSLYDGVTTFVDLGWRLNKSCIVWICVVFLWWEFLARTGILVVKILSLALSCLKRNHCELSVSCCQKKLQILNFGWNLFVYYLFNILTFLFVLFFFSFFSVGVWLSILYITVIVQESRIVYVIKVLQHQFNNLYLNDVCLN